MIFPVTFEEKIGFDRIRIMLSEGCLCQLGRNHAEALEMSFDEESVGHELNLTDDLRRILNFEENFPQDDYLDVTPSIRKLEHSGTFLEVAELAGIRKSAFTLRQLERYFHDDKIREKYPVICKEFSQLKVFPFVTDLINRILTKEGKVKDNASPELKQIRDQKKQKHTAVNRKIQTILRSAQQDGLTDADAEVTLREGRPVIPVSSGQKRKISGLVHDESASGKTVYIEPAEVVELNNQLRELEYAERREIMVILSLVTDELRPYADELLELYAQLGRIDFLRAKARLAIRLKGVKPILSADRTMQWKNAIHPLLYLSHQAEGKEVVPLDIKLEPDSRILLISGPNAGGKSVCLKTMGLLQYMLQCGLLVPMSENSEVLLFKKIFIDIGDEQSLENDLSTYSSHLLNMKHFIRYSDAATLLLIDEFGTGTEPALGGAIAEAILENLNKLEVYGVITTHYANLKHFASEAEGIVNGAMLFDTDKIQPLFRLSVGEPGSSFAIEIARKIGLSKEILDAASDKVGSDYINFEKHLREIIRDKRYYEEKRKKIRRVEKTLDGLYLNYSDELSDIQQERKKILKQAKEDAKTLLKDANKKVERTIREIRENEAEKQKTKAVREDLEQYKKALDSEELTKDQYDKKILEISEAGKKLAKYSPEIQQSSLSKKKVKKETDLNFQVGDTVKMPGMDTQGEVLEVHDRNILVAFGGMITSISRDKLIKEEGGKAKKSTSRLSQTNIQERMLGFKSEIDVRGQRGDEALTTVQSFIDDALMVSVRSLRILHGKGNGILRQLIRDYLKSTGVVKSMRDAHADQGGAGITFVELDI